MISSQNPMSDVTSSDVNIRGWETYRKSNPFVPLAGEASSLLDNTQITSQKDHVELAQKIEKLGFETQAKRMRTCSCTTYSVMCGCGIKTLSQKCNYYRFCEPSGYRRQKKLERRYFPVIMKYPVARSIYHPGLRLLTLTVKNCESLSEGIEKIKKNFNKLKRHKFFKDRVDGGLGTLEFKIGEDGLWHPHLHMIIFSRYINLKPKEKGVDVRIVEEWKKLTEDSSILDIRRVDNHKKGLKYALKYITKLPKDLTVEQKAEVFKCTFRKRLLFTFGCFYNEGEDLVAVCPECLQQYQYISDYEYHQFFDRYPWEKKPPPDKECLLFYVELNNIKTTPVYGGGKTW